MNEPTLTLDEQRAIVEQALDAFDAQEQHALQGIADASGDGELAARFGDAFCPHNRDRALLDALGRLIEQGIISCDGPVPHGSTLRINLEQLRQRAVPGAT